jgi:hypothetical protein
LVVVTVVNVDGYLLAIVVTVVNVDGYLLAILKNIGVFFQEVLIKNDNLHIDFF